MRNLCLPDYRPSIITSLPEFCYIHDQSVSQSVSVRNASQDGILRKTYTATLLIEIPPEERRSTTNPNLFYMENLYPLLRIDKSPK